MKTKIFDCHFHIIDTKYPLVKNEGFIPGIFRICDYMKRVNEFDLIGGVLVAGSYHGLDHRHITDALSELGSEFRGVAQADPDISDEEISTLNDSGIRGLRFNLKRGKYSDTGTIRSLAERVYALFGWHTELYIDPVQLAELSEFIPELPKVSIDHMGLSHKVLGHTLELAGKGVRIKATGFGRLDFDIRAAIRKISDVNDESLMFGTDLPSTRAYRPFRKEDVYLIKETVGEETAEKILFRNALSFYGFEQDRDL